MTTLQFSDRVAIVTGAGKGIGQACAIAFAKLGAGVILNGRTEGPVKETLAVIENFGGKALISVGDVSEERVVKDTVSLAMEGFGRLDFAVNIAGISPWGGTTAECTLESWQQVININLNGTWLGMKYQFTSHDRNECGRNCEYDIRRSAKNIRGLFALLCQ